MSTRSEILSVLDDLIRLEDVKACMVAKKGLDGVVPEKNEIDDIDLWKLIRKTTDDFFTIIRKFYDHGLKSIDSEIDDYIVDLTVLDKNTALIVIYSALANRGLLEVEIENTKREIDEIMR